MTSLDAPEIAALRRFGRFYTRRIGAIGPHLHGTDFPLTEARVMYELAHRRLPLASEIARELALDPAHLSRILKRFRGEGWLERVPAAHDARAYRLGLTPAGRGVFATLDEASRRQAREMLAPLTSAEREALTAALGRVEGLLARPGEGPAPERVTIRPHRPGDIGWVVSAHGRLYAEEYGWDIGFEALVAEIAARFLRDFQPAHEACFIAELDGTQAGSAFVVRADAQTARIRLVLVEKRAQGHGLGKRLVREAIGFARARGYARMVLWTNDILHAARAIYLAEGFCLVAEEKHHSFGQDLVGQTWELSLMEA